MPEQFLVICASQQTTYVLPDIMLLQRNESITFVCFLSAFRLSRNCEKLFSKSQLDSTLRLTVFDDDDDNANGDDDKFIMIMMMMMMIYSNDNGGDDDDDNDNDIGNDDDI